MFGGVPWLGCAVEGDWLWLIRSPRLHGRAVEATYITRKFFVGFIGCRIASASFSHSAAISRWIARDFWSRVTVIKSKQCVAYRVYSLCLSFFGVAMIPLGHAEHGDTARSAGKCGGYRLLPFTGEHWPSATRTIRWGRSFWCCVGTLHRLTSALLPSGLSLNWFAN